MKPSDLKKIAQRFTEKYYPQWLSRVDRIWDMFEKIDFNQIHSDSIKSVYGQENSLGISGDTDPQLKECMNVIAILAYVNQTVKEKDNVNEKEIRIQLTSAPEGIKISAEQHRKLENILAEILSSDIEEVVGVQNNIISLPDNAKKKENTRDFVVYLSRENGFGVNRFLAAEEDVHSRFLLDKFRYEIIIYHDTVELKTVKNRLEQFVFSSIDLHSNIYKLLVLFLKYKDKKIPFSELYHCAWEKGLHYQENLEDIDVLMEKLKPGVSTLRKKIERLKNFNIPYAKREDGSYMCKGSFQFCMVLNESIDQLYTLEVV